MLTNTVVWHLVIVALAKPQQGRKNWVVEPVKRDAEDGLVNQIDIYIFSRLCDGWWSDSYGKGQESSADKSKASKAPKEDDRVWPVCLQGEFGYYFVPLVQYFESLHWDRFLTHKGIQGDFYSLSDYTDLKFL